MPETAKRLAPGPSREIAAIERGLRATAGVIDPRARLSATSARLYWDTWAPNAALRGEVLATVCTELATSDHWALVTVHDPMEREGQQISNAVTVRREGEDA